MSNRVKETKRIEISRLCGHWRKYDKVGNSENLEWVCGLAKATGGKTQCL
jgi:hypothetical protein